MPALHSSRWFYTKRKSEGTSSKRWTFSKILHCQTNKIRPKKKRAKNNYVGSFDVDAGKFCVEFWAGWKPLAGRTSEHEGSLNHNKFLSGPHPCCNADATIDFLRNGMKTALSENVIQASSVCLLNVAIRFSLSTVLIPWVSPPCCQTRLYILNHFHCDWSIGPLWTVVETVSSLHTFAHFYCCGIAAHRKSPRATDNHETKVGKGERGGGGEECGPLYQYRWNYCGELLTLCPSWITFLMTQSVHNAALKKVYSKILRRHWGTDGLFQFKIK